MNFFNGRLLSGEDLSREQQSNAEREVYEAEVSRQLNEMDARTAEILVGMRRADTTSRAEHVSAGETSGSKAAAEGDGAGGEGSQRSCFSPIASIEEP